MERGLFLEGSPSGGIKVLSIYGAFPCCSVIVVDCKSGGVGLRTGGHIFCRLDGSCLRSCDY